MEYFEFAVPFLATTIAVLLAWFLVKKKQNALAMAQESAIKDNTVNPLGRVNICSQICLPLAQHFSKMPPDAIFPNMCLSININLFEFLHPKIKLAFRVHPKYRRLANIPTAVLWLSFLDVNNL